jgi:hypothetical protein
MSYFTTTANNVPRYTCQTLLVLLCVFTSQVSLGQKKPKKDSTIINRLPRVNTTSSSLLSSYESPANQLKLVPPNVASMEQYGNLPINYSTGQLNYSLPLHTIAVDNTISIPIQLSYNNTGLKPDQVPTWVGNGWELSVGGNIVQYVKGNDDFSGNGLQFSGNRQRLQDYFTGNLSNTDRYYYSQGVDNGEIDSQFDIFSVNILGRTAKFYFDGSTVHFFNYQPWKVSFTNNQFTITDERGTKFVFALVLGSSGSFSDGFIYGNTDPFLVGTKTWYLSQIITAPGVLVNFSYSYDVQYQIDANHASYSRGATANAQGCSFRAGFEYVGQSSNVVVGQFVLSEIAWKGKRVTFETIPREDLQDPNGNKAKALSRIKVYDESNAVVRQVGFDYGYLNNANDRLQLNAVSVLDKSTGDKVQTFSFDYHAIPQNSSLSVPIPSLKVPGNYNPANHAVDHWGYFNGKSNTSKVPKARYAFPSANANTTLFGDADRAADGDFSRLGMLKRITYPTKGYTEIQYESNMVNFGTYTNIPFFMKEQRATTYTPFFDSGTKNCTTGSTTGQFTISQYITAAKINWHLVTDSPDDVSRFTLILENHGPQLLIQDYSQSLKNGELLTDLSPGTYTYTLEPGCVSQSGSANAEALFSVELPVSPVGGVDLSVGGNRVAKIIDYDPDTGSNERTITYQNSILLDEPYYISGIETGASYGGAFNPCISCGISNIVGENNVFGWDGFHVEYRQATELFGQDGANGKKVYTYDANVVLGGPISVSPYPAYQNLSWRSGSLNREETYQKQNNNFDLRNKIKISITLIQD